MLDQVDLAMKKSKLFTMTQLSATEATKGGKVAEDNRRTKDRSVIEKTLETMMGTDRDNKTKGLVKSQSTSSFKSNHSHDSTYKPEKSTINQSPRAKIERSKEAEKLLHFQEYLSKEVKDVADFKRFLG